MATAHIGIDTGGTHTTMEVRLGDDTPVRFTFEESLSGYLPLREYAGVLARILEPVRALWHEPGAFRGPVSIFIGSAGFSASTSEPFRRAIAHVIPEVLGGSASVVGAANDATTLLLGHAARGVVIAGTGSHVLVRADDGEIQRSGGQDWVACDQGSGFWIGLRGTRQVFLDAEAGVRSPLLVAFENLYGIPPGDAERRIAAFRALAVADGRMKADIARFAGPVCAAAEAGDPDAQDLVAGEAGALADLAARALRRARGQGGDPSEMEVVACGGLFANPFYRDAFEGRVNLRLHDLRHTGSAVRWHRVSDGLEAAVNLAYRLPNEADALTALAPAFRPVVVRFP